MAFAPLSYRENLRDIEACLRAMRSKLYHMGIRGGISRNNLACQRFSENPHLWCSNSPTFGDWVKFWIAPEKA